MVNLGDVGKIALDYGLGLLNNKDVKLPHVKLDEIELVKRTDKSGTVKEIRSIGGLSVYGGRSIVELPIPGSIGNVLQDMGRSPLVVAFNGVLIGPDAMTTLKSIKDKFELSKPIPFSSDIAVISDISKVIIEKFSVHFDGGIMLAVRYSMVLKEFVANAREHPKEEKKEEEAPSQEEEAKEEVEKKTEEEYSKTTEWVEYTIQKGDTLSEIAQSYDMSWQELYNGDGGSEKTNKERLNKQKEDKGRPEKSIDNPDLIYPDDIILVPNKEPKKSTTKKESINKSKTIQHKNSEERSSGEAAIVKLKEIKVKKDLQGTYEFTLEAKTTGGVDGKIMWGLNARDEYTAQGLHISEIEWDESEDYKYRLEADMENLKAGDLIQVWGIVYTKDEEKIKSTEARTKSASNNPKRIYVKNMNLCFEPAVEGAFANQDP